MPKPVWFELMWLACALDTSSFYDMDKILYSNFQKSSGPGCSKLTTLLVNVSLKFQTLISNIHQYSAKASLIFSTTNISVFGYKVLKHFTS